MSGAAQPLLIGLPGAPAYPAFDVLFGTGAAGRYDNGPGLALQLGAPELTVGAAGAAALRVPVPAAVSTDSVEVAAGVHLQHADVALARFLREQLRGVDHIGINIAAGTLAEADWQRFLAALTALLPVYRLEIPTPNDIVIVLLDAAGSALELVYDRGIARSSFHVCVRVDAPRAAVESAFAAPFGAYKPGDEAFFRSVALPPGLALPAYVDIAFADGGIAPWPVIVEHMGRRLGAAPAPAFPV